MSVQNCRAALFHGHGLPFELAQVPVPTPHDGEAVVRIDCCTICGSDLHTITGARIEPVPSVLGHEILGTVQATGPVPLCDVNGVALNAGDRITWSVCMSCGRCDRCKNGLPQKCRSIAKFGHEVADGRNTLSGGLAEYILLRAGTSAVRIPDGIPDEVMCPVNCATATVAAAYRLAGPLTDRRVLILGAGMLGLTAAAFAKFHGAAQVVVCDINQQRLVTARRFGADDTAQWNDNFEQFRNSVRCVDSAEYDIVLELSGAASAVEAACQLADVGGAVILVGTVMSARPVQIDPERIVRRCLSIHGLHNYTPDDLRTAVCFLEQSHADYPFAELVQASFELADIDAAVDFAVRERPVRVAVRP